MNVHALIDKISIKSTEILVVSNKIFSRSIVSPTYAEHLENIELEVPAVDGVGTYEVRANTPAGEMNPAFLIYRWKGRDFPTLVYHHGNLERPFNFHFYMKNTFRDIFASKDEEIEANLIAIRAPFHKGSIIKYAKKIGHLNNFIALLSVSTRLIEHLVSYFKSRTGSRIIVCGISLGGLAANLHRTYYNTADVYIPLCAGAALGDVFFTSAYRRVAKVVHENKEIVQNIIDFEDDFKRIQTHNVFPLLARYDQLFRFEIQKDSYAGHPVEVLDKGHWTGALSSRALRRHVLSHM